MKQSKLDQVKTFLNNPNNMEFITIELSLYLDNNHGVRIQELFSLVDIPKEDHENYRVLTKQEARELKWQLIDDTIDIIYWSVEDISKSTIKKAMKELNIYDTINKAFINSLNGEKENIGILSKITLTASKDGE